MDFSASKITLGTVQKTPSFSFVKDAVKFVKFIIILLKAFSSVISFNLRVFSFVIRLREILYSHPSVANQTLCA